MGFFSWFRTPSKVSSTGSLLLFNQVVMDNGYGRHKVKIKKLSGLHEYYVGLLLNKALYHRIIISSSINGRVIPMIDCDSKVDYCMARERLNGHKFRHAVFQSGSTDHYWIFPDMSCLSFEAAWEATSYIPGCDHNYLKFTRSQGVYYVRGELKAMESAPELIHSNCVEPNVVQFINLLDDHFKDARIKAIAFLKAFKRKI